MSIHFPFSITFYCGTLLCSLIAVVICVKKIFGKNIISKRVDSVMLQFIIGVVVGAIVSLFVFAICSMAGTDDQTDTQCTEKTGEENVPSK